MVSDAASAIGPLLDRAPCGFLSFADDGTLRATNATLLDMLGFSRDALVGQHIDTILPVGSRIFYQTHLFPMLRLHGHVEEIFLMLRASNGEDVATLLNAVRRERDGEWVTDCILMRVVERRKFEEALLRARHEADDARASAESHRAELEVANAQLEQQALELELSQEQLQQQAAELEVQADELHALNDQLLERAEELERQREVAYEANRAKSAFLAMMSHELRTPLNAIGGYLQLLEMGIHGPVTDAQAETFGKIERSQRHLLRMINDLLNLARVEAGVVEYSLAPTDLCTLVQHAFPMIEPQLAARKIRYAANVPPDVIAHADRDKVEQILLNLLSNAVKFTPANGHVTIEGGATPGDDAHVYLRVRDTGVGIPRDRLDQVFEPFVQVDASRTRRAEGAGLGLAISRDLARGMGGDLTVESTPGEGSTFTLTLPNTG